MYFLLLFIIGAISWSHPVSAGPSPPPSSAVACKPQGLLRLEQPYQQPRRVALPFCQQYGCSCCNASHALAVQRATRAIAEDDDLSQECKRRLLRLSCRVCDPEVGTGVKQHICRDTCEALYQACAQDFFSYEAGSGLVTPCLDQPGGVMLVCSQLSDLVSGAAEFCSAAGLGHMTSGVSEEASCFDGSPVGPEACPAVSAAAEAQQQSQQQRKRRKAAASRHRASDPISWLISLLPWKMKRRHKEQLVVVAELFIGTAISALMAWVVVLVLQRVMQPSAVRRRPSGPPPSNVRDVLARAAEVRHRAAASGTAGLEK